jgi:hypothetical protein
MNGDVKRSYEYAIGCFKATSRQPLSAEQWQRLKSANRTGAEKLLAEFGFPAVNEECSAADSIEKDMAATVAFIRENAPDGELVDLLFFEQDALNLKILVKSARMGQKEPPFELAEGGTDREILKVCAQTEDFSLLGKDLEESLARVPEITDPGELSCVIDTAFLMHSVDTARKKFSFTFARLLEEYGAGRNRLTALRLRRLGKDPADFPYAFFPESKKIEKVNDENKTEDEIVREVAKAFDDVIGELGFDEGMGFIARYYFLKKNDASALRLLFAEKSLGGGDADE